MLDEKTLDEWFSYRAPNPQQVEQMNILRDKAKEYAHLINRTVTDGPDKTFAIRLLRMTVMTHNLGIMFPLKEMLPTLREMMMPTQMTSLDEAAKKAED